MSVSITLNGRLVEVPGNKTTVTYEELVKLADMTGMPRLTVNRADKVAGFTMTPRQGCHFLGGEVVNVAHTGTA